MDREAPGLGRILGLVLALGLALGWLLPNHYPPWPAFHTDAWVALLLLCYLWWSIWAARTRVRFSALSFCVLGASIIPPLQHLLGEGVMAGAAFTGSAYLLGFALAIKLGELSASDGVPETVSSLCVAVACAALASVALQVNQWTGSTQNDTPLDIWVMYLPPGMRPYANLGQPNQLATLLLWGLLGLMWGWREGVLRAWMVLAGGTVLAFGLALTQSRTGWVSLFTLTVLACVWRNRDFGRPLARMSLTLYGVYLIWLISQPYLAELLGLSSQMSMADRLSGGVGGDLRWPAWRMFLDASFERPWFGYGWGNTREAMFTVIPRYPELAGVQFAHAHMLPLDLVIWVGWPTGLAFTGLFLWWFVMMARSLQTAKDALLFAALIAVGIHALLELPLHYAYFLLPAGVFIGALNAHHPSVVRCFSVHKVYVAALALMVTLLLATIGRDYFNVERSFVELRMESQRVGTRFNREPPETLLLHQWREFIEMARTEPRPELTEEDLARWRALVMYFPSVSAVDKYMKALELKGKREEIAYFRDRFCAIMPLDTCRLMIQRWAAAAGAAPGPSPASAARPEPAREPLPTPESARSAGSVGR